MKIAFIHTQNVNDKNIWSGIIYFLYKSLEKKFEEVVFFQPKQKRFSILKYFFGIIDHFISRITGKQFINFYYSFFLPKKLSRQVDDFVKNNPVECIISTVNQPFIYTKNRIPLIIISDATVRLLYNEYSKSKGWSRLLYWNLERSAKMVADKATLIVSSSTDTTNSLIEYYKVPSEKIATIHFGANIDDDIICSSLIRNIREKQVRFLFVGKDWGRKGGDMAVEVCDELIKQNIQVKLTIVGCKVPELFKRDYIKNYVYLDKNSITDFALLKELYNTSHFFSVFSRAEMYGIVFCEAAAFGLPSLAFAVGGIKDIVINNVTGIVLPVYTKPVQFAKEIISLINEPDRYNQMSINAVKRYNDVLNWKSFAEALKDQLQSRIN